MKHAIPSHAFSVLLLSYVQRRTTRGGSGKKKGKGTPAAGPRQTPRVGAKLAGPLSRRKDAPPISATRFDFFAVFRLFPRLLGSLSLLPIKSLEMHGKTSRSPCRVTSVGWIKWESRAPGKRARSPGLAGPPALASFVPEETEHRPAGRRSGSHARID